MHGIPRVRLHPLALLHTILAEPHGLVEAIVPPALRRAGPLGLAWWLRLADGAPDAVSSDESRFNVNGVFFEPGGGVTRTKKGPVQTDRAPEWWS